MKRAATLLLPLMLACPVPALAAPQVVATIKPIHSLVAQVMAGIGEPTLLVKGGASPHTYSLRPSDAAALEAADLVFWTGHGMEVFLGEALGTLGGKATVVELSESPGLVTLPVREGGAFEPHDHGAKAHAGEEHEAGHADHAQDEAGHDHAAEAAVDMHFWLDPANAAVLVKAIADWLADADPDNAAAYAANAAEVEGELAELTAELEATLAPAKGKPFIVFHDAYQYFEKRFGLSMAGSITVSPEAMPGAQRIAELKARVAELGATCIFAEPQFEPAIISAITEGTAAKTGVLDPEAGDLPEGPGLYAELLRGLAKSLAGCLAGPA